jgi:hypothetical protein
MSLYIFLKNMKEFYFLVNFDCQLVICLIDSQCYSDWDLYFVFSKMNRHLYLVINHTKFTKESLIMYRI